MENQVVEFISKIYTEGESPHPTIRKLTKGTLIIIGVLCLFEIWLGDFSLDRTKITAVILCIFVLTRTRPVAGYKSIVTKVELNEEAITILYDGLDRSDKMGPRVEKTKVQYENITKLEYSTPLRCLNIQGFPMESIRYLKQPIEKEFVKDYFDKKEEKRTLLYVAGQEKEKIVNILKEKTGKKITELN